ncbi:MAG: alpha/beta hydrolase [Deltaproteobacteria bacterium]|nr:alpha/beta hydrolase [Deltaproteobacteria bacterium]
MKPTGVFIHGLESTRRGTKGLFFRERYPDMIIEDYLGSFSQRMEKLEGLLAGKSHLILVGSSYGGLMAAVYACLHEERIKKTHPSRTGSALGTIPALSKKEVVYAHHPISRAARRCGASGEGPGYRRAALYEFGIQRC